MKAFTQHLTGVIRVGEDADEYGKDWEYCCTYVANNPDVVVLMATKSDGGLKPAHVRAAIEEAQKMGFKTVIWERHKKDLDRVITVEHE